MTDLVDALDFRRGYRVSSIRHTVLNCDPCLGGTKAHLVQPIGRERRGGERRVHALPLIVQPCTHNSLSESSKVTVAPQVACDL